MIRHVRPSLILLDVYMPELNGWQVLRTLHREKLLKDCPVVMLTVDDDVQLGRALGVKAHLIKPLQVQELLDKVRQILNPGPAQEYFAGQTGAALAA